MRTVGTACLALGMYAGQGVAATWTLRVVGQGSDSLTGDPGRACERVVIEFEPICVGVADCKRDAKRLREVAIGQAVRVDLDMATAWRARVVSDTCWSPGALLPAGTASAGSIPLKVWPSLPLRGHFLLPRGTPTPTALTIRLRNPESRSATPASDTLPEVAQECNVTDQRWHCSIPAITLDIRLEVAGFAPLYLWDLKPTVPDGRNLGEWKLIRGASISGWMRSGGRQTLDSPIVELTPEVFGSTALEGDSRAKPTNLVAPNIRGFFQFNAVDVGTYKLTAKAKGLSPRTVFGLKIAGDREHPLSEPLSLDPLASLQLVLSPTATPQGSPWTVRLERLLPKTNFTSRLAEQAASLTGEVQFPELDTGQYQVVVVDGAGNTQATKTVAVEPRGTIVAIDLALVTIYGRISSGSEPLKAKLVFESLDGSKVEMHADEDGRFSGSLVREGRWRVEIQPDVPGAGRLVRTVQIKRSPGEEAAEVNIEIPGNRLEGIVVDENGHGVKAAVQVLRADSLFCHMLTDDEGKFHVFGIEEGELLLRAAGSGKKGFIEHDVRSMRRLERVEIVVRRQGDLRGRVTNVFGDRIAGTIIRYRGARVGVDGETVTSPSGAFQIRDLEADQPIDLIVLAPGYPVRILQFSPWPATEEPVRIEVGGPGSIAILDMKSPRPPFIAGPGSLLSVFSLLPWEGGSVPGYDQQAWTLTVPLEAGRYALCPDAVPSAACRIFFVRPGAEVRVPSVFGERSETPERP